VGVGVVKDAVVVEMESFKIPELRQAPARVEARLSFMAGSFGTFCMRAATSLSRPPTLPNFLLVNSLGRCSSAGQHA
jgi:hypothetical protein